MTPDYYESSDAPDLAHRFSQAGLHNVGQLIKMLFRQIDILEERVEELEEQYNYEDEYQQAQAELDQVSSGRDAFAEHFTREFEKKNIKFKTIGGTEFAIMKSEDLDELKSRFHNDLD